MIKAIRFEKTGGPEVLEYKDYDLPAPAAGHRQHQAIAREDDEDAYRVMPVVEELPDERVVDDRDLRRLRPIVAGEGATTHDCNPHDVEIRRSNHVGERAPRARELVDV